MGWRLPEQSCLWGLCASPHAEYFASQRTGPFGSGQHQTCFPRGASHPRSLGEKWYREAGILSTPGSWNSSMPLTARVQLHPLSQQWETLRR